MVDYREGTESCCDACEARIRDLVASLSARNVLIKALETERDLLRNSVSRSVARERLQLSALKLWSESVIMSDDDRPVDGRTIGIIHGGDVQMAANATRKALDAAPDEGAAA